MPSIVIPRRQLVQPQGLSGVNPDIPPPSLVFNGGQIYRGEQPVSNAAETAAGRGGRGVRNGAVVYTANADRYLSTTGGSALVVLSRVGAAQASTAFAFGTYNKAEYRFSAHLTWSDGNVYFDFGGTSAPNRVVATSQAIDSTPAAFVLTAGPGGMRIFRDGRLIASSSTAPTRGNPTGCFFGLGLDPTSGATPTPQVDTGATYYAQAFWPEQINDSIAEQLSADPWGLFKAPARRLYFDTGGTVLSPVALAGAASAGSSANAVLSALLNVTGNATVQALATATLTTRLNLAGAAIAQALATGSLQSVIGLFGSATGSSSATGTVRTGSTMGGSATGGSSASGTVSVRANLTGGAAVASIGTAALSLGVRLTGAAIGSSAAAATAAVRAALSGSASSSSTASTQLAVTIPLTGLATSLSLATGNLQVAAAGGGTATAGSSATGQISVSTPLTGAAQALSQASATLTLAVTLTGAALASSLASAGLSINQLLTGSASAGSSASGSITSTAAGGGSATASSSATGTLAVRLSLSGAALASAQAVGLLNSSQTISLAGGATVTSVGDADIEVTVPLTGSALAGAAASGQGLVVGINLAGSAVTVSQARGYIGNPPVTVMNERYMVRLERRFKVLRFAREPVVVSNTRRV